MRALDKRRCLAKFACVTHVGGAAFVAVVKPADLGKRDDFALIGYLNRTCVRAIHLERQVRPALIVVSNIVGKNPSQMVSAEDDDVV